LTYLHREKTDRQKRRWKNEPPAGAQYSQWGREEGGYQCMKAEAVHRWLVRHVKLENGMLDHNKG